MRIISPREIRTQLLETWKKGQAICHLYPLELQSEHSTMIGNKGVEKTVTENNITKQRLDLTVHDKKQKKAHLIA